MLIGKFRIRKKRNDILEDLNSGRFDAKPGGPTRWAIQSFRSPILFSSMDLEFLYWRASKAT